MRTGKTKGTHFGEVVSWSSSIDASTGKHRSIKSRLISEWTGNRNTDPGRVQTFISWHINEETSLNLFTVKSRSIYMHRLCRCGCVDWGSLYEPAIKAAILETLSHQSCNRNVEQRSSRSHNGGSLTTIKESLRLSARSVWLWVAGEPASIPREHRFQYK